MLTEKSSLQMICTFLSFFLFFLSNNDMHFLYWLLSGADEAKLTEGGEGIHEAGGEGIDV